MIWGLGFGLPTYTPPAPSPASDLTDLRFARTDLNERVEHLTLLTQAAWELLSEKCGVTQEMLLAKVKEIDLRDGTLDNRRALKIKTCQACKRVMNPRHAKCLYCGAENLLESAFDTV
jgi:hypothetical protein